MLKVVHNDRAYYLTPDFSDEVTQTGGEIVCLSIQNGKLTRTVVPHSELGSLLPERVHGWTFSVDKSITVFVEGLDPIKRVRATQLLNEAVYSALAKVLPLFTARVGAQGKLSLPAQPQALVGPHGCNYSGIPNHHWHIEFLQKVFVESLGKYLAFNSKELYQLRRTFNQFVSHEIGCAFQREFGVRAEVKGGNLQFPDVPQSICKAASNRSHQIDAFITKNSLQNTPRNRAFAAILTRKARVNRDLAKLEFNHLLKASGFSSQSICNRVTTADQQAVNNSPARQIARAAKDLSKTHGRFTRAQLLAASAERIGFSKQLDEISKSIEKVLNNPAVKKVGESHDQNHQAFTVTNSQKEGWRKVATKVDSVLTEKVQPRQSPGRDSENSQRSDTASQATGPQPEASRKSSENGSQAAEDKSQSNSKSHRPSKWAKVIYAVGKPARALLKNAKEAYLRWKYPVIVVDGKRDPAAKGSIERLVRDLKPLSRRKSHRRALAAMLKARARNLVDRLAYGEVVYDMARTPKKSIPRNATIVIKNASLARQKDLLFIIRKSVRSKANVLISDRNMKQSCFFQAASKGQKEEARQTYRRRYRR